MTAALPRALPDPVVEPTIKAARLAAILDISVRAVLYAVERKEIPSIRVGRSVRIPTARVLEQFGLAPDIAKAGVTSTGLAETKSADRSPCDENDTPTRLAAAESTTGGYPDRRRDRLRR